MVDCFQLDLYMLLLLPKILSHTQNLHKLDVSRQGKPSFPNDLLDVFYHLLQKSIN
jgi:hypothetical protein